MTWITYLLIKVLASCKYSTALVLSIWYSAKICKYRDEKSNYCGYFAFWRSELYKIIWLLVLWYWRYIVTRTTKISLDYIVGIDFLQTVWYPKDLNLQLILSSMGNQVYHHFNFFFHFFSVYLSKCQHRTKPAAFIETSRYHNLRISSIGVQYWYGG